MPEWRLLPFKLKGAEASGDQRAEHPHPILKPNQELGMPGDFIADPQFRTQDCRKLLDSFLPLIRVLFDRLERNILITIYHRLSGDPKIGLIKFPVFSIDPPE